MEEEEDQTPNQFAYVYSYFVLCFLERLWAAARKPTVCICSAPTCASADLNADLLGTVSLQLVSVRLAETPALRI